MNRRARRIRAKENRVKSLVWGKVQPQATYAEIGENDGRDLLMKVFRAVASDVPNDVFEDEVLFDGTMSLIRHNLLNVWFAVDDSATLHVRSELILPERGAA